MGLVFTGVLLSKTVLCKSSLIGLGLCSVLSLACCSPHYEWIFWEEGSDASKHTTNEAIKPAIRACLYSVDPSKTVMGDQDNTQMYDDKVLNSSNVRHCLRRYGFERVLVRPYYIP